MSNFVPTRSTATDALWQWCFIDAKDVGLELIKQGLAWAYEHYLPEAAARKSKHSIWPPSAA
jgi:endonuclease YncB( thermonuclease family)